MSGPKVDLSQRLLDLLRSVAVGHDNAHTIRVLADRLGCGRRALERATEDIRNGDSEVLCSETRTKDRAGNPVRPGLYLAATPAEIDQYYAQIESRIRVMCIHRAKIRKASLAKWGRKPAKQLSLFDYQADDGCASQRSVSL